MKKLLCLVLTLALALVSVAALAESVSAKTENTEATVPGIEAPEVPEIPEAPDMPEAPEAPEVPEVPEFIGGDGEATGSKTGGDIINVQITEIVVNTTTQQVVTNQNVITTQTVNNVANEASETSTDSHDTTVNGNGNAVGEGNTAETTGDTTTTTTENEKSYNGATKGASDKKSGGKSSSGSGSKGSSASTAGANDQAPSIEIIIVDDTAETVALKNEFAAAIKAGDPKTALPENVASKLSADLKTVNEFVTAKLVGDVSNIASATVNVKFPTKYATSDKAVVLFGIPAGGSTNWITVNGVIESDGSITMVLNSSVLDALVGKTFAMVVLSK